MRFEGLLARLGEPFTVEGVVRRGLMGTVTPNQARIYMESGLVDGISRPLVGALVAWDDATSPMDEAVVDGHALTVYKVVPLRFGGETFARLVLLA